MAKPLRRPCRRSCPRKFQEPCNHAFQPGCACRSARREITYLDPLLWSIPNDSNISGFEIAMSPVIFVQNLETLKKLADDYLVVLLFQFSVIYLSRSPSSKYSVARKTESSLSNHPWKYTYTSRCYELVGSQ